MKDQRMFLCKPKPLARLISGLFMAGLCSSPVLAENWADRINLTGFMSAKAQVLDEGSYFNGDTDTGIGEDSSWRGTMLGLNLTIPLGERISIASQFLSTQEDGDYALHLDWGFVAVGLTDDVKIRAGKLKFPTGIVNEYVSVGNAYPWITPPMLFYSEEDSGSNVTREAYTGASTLWEYSIDEMTVGVDLFGGEVAAESRKIRKLGGVKLHLDWNEEIAFQASYYRGTMRNTTEMPIMEGRVNRNFALGMRIDWNNIIGYAEWATTDMETDTMDGTSWYTTWGYQMGDWLPHLTYQYFEKGEDSASEQEQKMTTAGLRYDLTDTVDLKFEYSIIKTEKGRGLFESTPLDDNVKMLGIAIDAVF